MADSDITGFNYKILSHIYRFTERGTKPLIAYKFANIIATPAEKVYEAVRYLEERLLVNFDNGAIWMTPRGIAELEKPVAPTFTSPVTHNTTNINAPNTGNVQTGGAGNVQNIRVTNNPDFDNSIRAILELLQSAHLNEDVRDDVIRDVHTVNRIAIDDPSAQGAERAMAKLSYIETALKGADIALKIAPYLPHLYSFFQNLSS